MSKAEEVAAVARELFPSSNSGSLGSQSEVLADRIKGSRCGTFSRACAGSIGSPTDLLGSSASSSSSQGLPTHRAIVELRCCTASHLSAAALSKGMQALRVTKQSHDLLTDAGRRLVTADVKDLLHAGHKVHLWASLPPLLALDTLE